jgi:cytochrome P450
VVQLYVHDAVASITRPVKELRGFARVALEPGGSKRIGFELSTRQLAFYDRDMRFAIEAGTIEVMLGSSSEGIRLTGSFESGEGGSCGRDLQYARAMSDSRVSGASAAALLSDCRASSSAALRRLLTVQSQRCEPKRASRFCARVGRWHASCLRSPREGEPMADSKESLFFGAIADPYPVYHLLRTDDPVHFVDMPGLWILTRYADVSPALRDPRLSADRFHLTQVEMRTSALISSLANMMLLRDPPAHTRLRSLVSKAFTPRVIEGLRGKIEAVVDELLTAAASRGSMDLIADFARADAVGRHRRLLGVRVEDREQLKLWSDDLIKMLDGSIALANFPAAEKSAGELKEYLEALFPERRANPRDDLISAMLAARDQGDRLSDDELFASCVLLLLAGHETTTNLIGHGVLARCAIRSAGVDARRRRGVAAHRHRRVAALRLALQLTSRVAEATWRSAASRCRRTGSEPLSGRANRDPAQFPDPDRLDIRREDNPRRLRSRPSLLPGARWLASRADGHRRLTRRFPISAWPGTRSGGRKGSPSAASERCASRARTGLPAFRPVRRLAALDRLPLRRKGFCFDALRHLRPDGTEANEENSRHRDRHLRVERLRGCLGSSLDRSGFPAKPYLYRRSTSS